MNKWKKILLSVSAVLMLLALLLWVIDVFSFDRGFYTKQYRELDTASSMEISSEDLEKMTDVLLLYLRDKRADLTVEISVSGKKRNAYNEREILHMKDVKSLYRRTVTVRNLFAVISATVFGVFVALDRNFFRRNILAAFITACGVLLVSVAALAVLVWNDFDSFWIQFHRLLFTNDLWLLDPRTDLLIQLVPQPFFFSLVTRIVAVYFGLLGVIFAAFKFRVGRKHE